MSDAREQRPIRRASNNGNPLQHDDFANLLLRSKCQHGDLRLLLHRPAAGSPVIGTSELHHQSMRPSSSIFQFIS
jgi:hypothetical protein